MAVVQGGAVQFVRADHIDRPVFATDAAGAVVWQQSYDPFGRVVAGRGSDARFAGQWFSAENGLHQNWMRDYDATLGRYIQADPLGLVDGASVYGYALQNPARWSDPRGQQVAGTGGSAAVYGEAVGLLCRPVIAAAAGLSSAAMAILMATATPVGDGTCGQGCFASEESKTPNTGKPGSTHVNPGSGQVREYGPDGRPIKDIDYDHDHGQGVPHVHDWIPSPGGGFPKRGPGRPPKPGELPGK